jgi:hypothetical protein
MALAAVLVVLMGAGSIVGMNLIKLSSENRSQAGGTGSGCTCRTGYKNDCANSGLMKCNDQFDNVYGKCDDNYVCTDVKRCHCCNGWIIEKNKDTACSSTCKNSGGEYSASCSNVEKCSCQTWKDGCGTNCTFPDTVQGKVNSLAKANCAAYVAMCDVSTGKTSYEKYGPGQACYGKLDQCKNPHADSSCNSDTLSCSGLSPSSSSPKVGESVTLTCSSSGSGMNHYEFRYKVGSGDYQTLSASDNKATLTISATGTYTAQCRVCKSSDSGDCTAWGMAQ